MSFALLLMYTFFAMPSKPRSLVPFLASEGYLKWWFVVTLMGKLATTELVC